MISLQNNDFLVGAFKVTEKSRIRIRNTEFYYHYEQLYFKKDNTTTAIFVGKIWHKFTFFY